LLDKRIPHSEYIHNSAKQKLALIFKLRGCPTKPSTVKQLLEFFEVVIRVLMFLHSLSFMHRDLR